MNAADAAPHNVQWSQALVGAGCAGAWSVAAAVPVALWQMTENGSKAALAGRGAEKADRIVERAIV